jgi:hypothetical protein
MTLPDAGFDVETIRDEALSGAADEAIAKRSMTQDKATVAGIRSPVGRDSAASKPIPVNRGPFSANGSVFARAGETNVCDADCEG